MSKLKYVGKVIALLNALIQIWNDTAGLRQSQVGCMEALGMIVPGFFPVYDRSY